MEPPSSRASRITTDTRATMIIDAECRVVDDMSSAERQVWDPAFER
jgi:hypothetical protein